MNILVTNCSSDLYGSSRILAIVLEALAEKHNLTLILPDNGPIVGLLKQRNINIDLLIFPDMPIVARRMFSPSGLLKTIRNYNESKKKLKDLIKEKKIDVAYVNTLAGLFFLKAFKDLGVKTVLHVHEILEKPKKVVSHINHYALKWADKIVCVSKPVADNLYLYDRKNYAKKVEVIFNGIDDQLASVEKTTNKVLVTLIGRITEAKGIWYFLETLSLMDKQVAEQCLFKIIGGPAPGKEDLIQKLNQDIANHKYKEYIQYFSFIEDVREHLNMTDILLVPSLMADPFPTTILEGLSAGKPVIATNGGGAVQSIEDGVSGRLINRDTPNQFRDILTILITDETERRRLGANARERFLNMFQVNIFKENIRKVFDSQ